MVYIFICIIFRLSSASITCTDRRIYIYIEIEIKIDSLWLFFKNGNRCNNRNKNSHTMNTTTSKEDQYKKLQKMTPSSSEVGRSDICFKITWRITGFTRHKQIVYFLSVNSKKKLICSTNWIKYEKRKFILKRNRNLLKKNYN